MGYDSRDFSLAKRKKPLKGEKKVSLGEMVNVQRKNTPWKSARGIKYCQITVTSPLRDTRKRAFLLSDTFFSSLLCLLSIYTFP